MAVQVLIPVLGEAITEAHLVNWLKVTGETVKRGDELAELETDKATLVLECPGNGTLLSILIEAGSTVYPGQVAAIVGKPGEEKAEQSFGEPNQTDDHGQDVILPTAVPSQANHQVDDRNRVSPAARRRAQELGIDISLITPEHPSARITSEDVERYQQERGISRTISSESSYHRITLNAIHKTLAEKMVQSATQIPQFSVSIEVDATELFAAQARLAEKGYEVSLTALLIHGIAQSLQRHNLLNSRYNGDEVLVYDNVNIAVAVDTPHGLVAPVILRVEQLTLEAISTQLKELVSSARAGRLSLEQISGATFTISNLGMFGVHQFTPLINPPQSAILGISAARPAIQPVSSGLRIIQSMNLTLVADHRLLDGATVAAFLADLRDVLEKRTEPE